ncbi:dihydrodipicolinate synthase family protein [haloarchaeon 3A1-DGR]|nr:dihydrodipicolinate synthase family protein [haloarchaeon 3A1-DGR]
MSYQTIKDSLRDAAFTLATPFDVNTREVRSDALKENVRALDRAGAGLFIPNGNTGEYYSLSHSERVEVVEATVDATDETVIAGAGGSTKTVKQLIDEYEAVGVDGVMIMHPSHTYLHERGVRQYYHDVAESTDLPIVLYKRGPKLSDRTIVELSLIENVVGVKYAVNDINGFSSVVDAADGDVTWVTGIAERFAPSYALEGAEGFTTGIGNFVPGPVLELRDAIESEEWDRAREIRNTLRPFENLRTETGNGNTLDSANNVPAVKHGMELAGLYGGPTRAPLVELDDEDRERAREYYERITETLETSDLAE